MAEKTLEERLEALENVLNHIDATLTSMDDMNKAVLAMVTFNPDEEVAEA